MSFTCAYTEAVSPLKAISRVVTCVPAPFCPAGRTLMRSTQFSSAQSVVATGTEPPRILSDLATPPFVLESSISAAFCSGWVLLRQTPAGRSDVSIVRLLVVHCSVTT